MNRSLKTLYIFNGIFVFASSLLGPLYALFVEGIDKSVIAVSSSWSAYLGSTTVFTYLMARWGDRVKQKEYLLAIGYLIRSVAWFSYIFTGSLAMLLVLQFLLGIGEAFGTAPYQAIFAEHLDDHHHVKDYALWKVISNLVGALATFLGGVIVSIYGFVPLFIFMGVLSLVSMFGILLSPKELL